MLKLMVVLLTLDEEVPWPQLLLAFLKSPAR
jgi:hypothetical protein